MPDDQPTDRRDTSRPEIDTGWTGVWIVFAMMFLTLCLAFGV